MSPVERGGAHDASRSFPFRVAAALSRACAALSILLILGTFGLTVVAVFMRYVLHSPLLWSDEVTGWMLVAMISCGVAEADRRGDHIAIDLLTDRLRGPSRAVQRVFAGLAFLVLAVVLFLSTWEAVEFSRMVGSYTTGHLEIPGWIPQAPLMLAAAMLVLVALTRILDTLAGRSQ